MIMNALTSSVTLDRSPAVAQGGSGLGGSGGDGFSFGGYGGIVGHTELRVRSRAWIEDSVKISTSPASRTVDDRVGAGDGGGHGNTNDGTWTASVELTVLGTHQQPIDKLWGSCDAAQSLCAMISAYPR